MYTHQYASHMILPTAVLLAVRSQSYWTSSEPKGCRSGMRGKRVPTGKTFRAFKQGPLHIGSRGFPI